MGPRVVVGAALLDGGRVLAAHRPGGGGAPGGWELPGGKVEPGESPADALSREIDEELGCRVEVLAWLDGESAIGDVADDLVLRVAAVRLASGTPTASEHDELRWVGPGELDDLAWLPADRPFLPGVRRMLEQRAP